MYIYFYDHIHTHRTFYVIIKISTNEKELDNIFQLFTYRVYLRF